MRALLAVPFFVLAIAGCTSKEAHGVEIQDIHGLALDPGTTARLYVATHHGLFVGEDDLRWSAVTENPFDMMGFTMHPTNPNIMYASGHPGRLSGGDWAVGVVKSMDGGRTWTTMGLRNEVDFHALAMEEGPADTLYGFHKGKFYVSRDGGSNWQSSAVPFAVSALAVQPETGTVLAATNRGLERIGRFGNGSWDLMTPGEAVAVATSKGDPSLVLAYFASGGLQATRNAGQTWASMNWTVPDDDYAWGIAIDPQNSQTVYTGTLRGSIHKTTDGGATWNMIR